MYTQHKKNIINMYTQHKKNITQTVKLFYNNFFLTKISVLNKLDLDGPSVAYVKYRISLT